VSGLRFIHEGTKYEINPERMTFREARDFRKATGYGVTQIGDAVKAGDEGVLQGLFWLAMRREDPPLRFSDLDEMPMGDFEEIGDDEAPTEEVEVDPTSPDGEPERTPTPSE